MKYYHVMTNECHSYECGQHSANHYVKYIALVFFYDFSRIPVDQIADSTCVYIDRILTIMIERKSNISSELTHIIERCILYEILRM